jgi:glycerol-3-phosphate acyltransferase PlsY
MIWIIAAGVALFAYLLGSVNSSIILTKLMGEKDIRREGSGNAGATNMLRTHGKKAGVLTLLGDVLKGILAVFLAVGLSYLVSKLIRPSDYTLHESLVMPTLLGMGVTDFELSHILPSFRYIAAFFVVLGHDFPVFFGFKGGKGVATSGAVAVALDWKIGLIIVAIALVIMIISRYVSLGSISAGIAYPFLVLGFMIGKGIFNPVYFVFAIVLGALMIYRHKANIKRLAEGTESKLGQKKEAQQ